MNYSDDFEENLNITIKWLMIVSLVAIVVWCLIQFVKFLMPANDTKNSTAIEMIKRDDKESEISEKEVLDELLDTENGLVDDELEFLPNDDGSAVAYGKYTFKINVSIMPENLYFTSLNYAEEQKQKRKIINNKVGDNYMDSVLSYGTLERWNPQSFPLKVYVAASMDVPVSHLNEIKNAFNKWEETTSGFVSFVYVDNAESADIVCSYPNDFYRTCESNETSVTSKQYFTYDDSGHIKKSYIELTSKDCNGVEYAEDFVYAFTLREIGHSLGLRGHSGMTQNKVLYYPTPSKVESVRPEIHIADINTLKLIYSVLPDKTNEDFSDSQLKKLIRPEEIWGDKVERFVKSDKAILYNISRSPDIPSLHVALANSYCEQGKYDEALEEYSKTIVMLNDAEFRARVYARMGDAFSLQKRYYEAIEAYKMSLKSLNNKRNLFEVYFNLGVTYYQQEKFEEAMDSFQTAISFAETKENFYRLLMDLTEVYIKLEKYPEAQKCAEKAYSMFETEDSRYLAAYVNILNKDYQGAQEFLPDDVVQDGTMIDVALMAQMYYYSQRFGNLEKLQEACKEKYSTNLPFEFK